MTEPQRPDDQDPKPGTTPANEPPATPSSSKECVELRQRKAPNEDRPEPCTKKDPHCKCPETPVSSTNCLEEMINKQAGDILAAAKMEAFNKELTDLLNAANAAIDPNSKTLYSREKYDTLVAEWEKQDVAIAGLIRQLVCAVPCWDCIIECHICPEVEKLRVQEKWLFNEEKFYDEQLYAHVYDLYDLQFWHQRNKAAKQRQFDRIKNVVNAWTNPAEKIKKALDDNKVLIESSCKVIGCDQPGPGKTIYDVFMRIVPLHLAIGPRSKDGTQSKIEKQYIDLCGCDQGVKVDCCGLDVGELSMRQRLIGGPKPYLRPPAEIPAFLCCLIKERYKPAGEALSLAKADLAKVEKEIADAEAKFEKQITGNDAQAGQQPAGNNGPPKQPGWIAVLENAAKASIPGSIDCAVYENEKAEEPTQQTPPRT